MNTKVRPTLFIGSSTSGLRLAQHAQMLLDSACDVELWTQGVFGLSEGTLEALLVAVERFDFALLILTPDDLVVQRAEGAQVARDNVIFELGLFVGAIGRERTFMLFDRDNPPRLPTDLAGITAATFRQHASGNVQAALGAPCAKIQDAIERLGIRSSKYSIDSILMPGRLHRAQTAPGWLAHAGGEAADVLVSGISCVNLLQLERSAIAQALESGARFRFVLLAPTASFLGSFDSQMSYASYAGAIPADIQRAVGILEHLKPHGDISWRFYDGVPVFSAVWVRAGQRKVCEVQFYSYGESPAERLTMTVNDQGSPNTYAYFQRSLERLWAASKENPGESGS